VRNAPVLRQGFLVGFQPRQEFDPAKDALCNVGGQLCSGSDDAVETETHFGNLPAQLEVDIAGTGAFGLAH